MKKAQNAGNPRRSFLKNGVAAAGAIVSLFGAPIVSARNEEEHAPITRGDIAIVTFLSALEQVEADLWIQYAELGGPNGGVPGTLGNSAIDLSLNGKAIATGLSPGYI